MRSANRDVRMKARDQPRRSETNRFAKKKATAPTTRLAATEAPEPSIARVGASTSHAAREAMTVAMSVGITLRIGGTRFELDRRHLQRMRERQARFDSDNSADSSGGGRRRTRVFQFNPGLTENVVAYAAVPEPSGVWLWIAGALPLLLPGSRKR